MCELWRGVCVPIDDIERCRLRVSAGLVVSNQLSFLPIVPSWHILRFIERGSSSLCRWILFC